MNHHLTDFWIEFIFQSMPLLHLLNGKKKLIWSTSVCLFIVNVTTSAYVVYTLYLLLIHIYFLLNLKLECLYSLYPYFIQISYV